ncbi:hypothetical protein Dda_1523 [Drechslerella dactyloides]|uniref:Uncharacterized protein n=1 Tax=Drechslerella dactyloides TaxID=74499 RepID=A0AAD6J484_DREDA|nr:hypothetical protein Dda_1523 [Drechslerella dactyloides]
MLSSFAILLITIAGAAIAGCLVWIVHLNLRARRLGLPSPTFLSYFRPPSSNPVYQATGHRSQPKAKGGFLGLFGRKGSTRGEFGPLGDDSGAWDSRGYGYYEEDAEMGLRVDTAAANAGRHQTAHNNKSSSKNKNKGGTRGGWEEEDVGDSPPRGRSRSRSPRPGYSVAANRGPKNGSAVTGNGNGNGNPFGDENRVRKSTDTGRSSVFTEEAF